MPTRVLLTSVFKPFGVDNLYSRKDSKIELFHNQITKYQGIYSLRAFFNSHGLHVIANNLEVPTTVLEFPTLDRFRREMKKGYDLIGIGAIMPNFQKVKRMVEEIRELSPRSKIVIGGFCASIPDLQKRLEVDYVCIGEGISFMRDLLGLPAEYKFQSPDTHGVIREWLGVPIRGKYFPQIVVGLGCSYGCDFCSPSHFFGRRHVRYFKNGRDLFEEMCRVEKVYHSNSIGFLGDDNFLLDLKRAEELRQCVVASGKVFKTLVFGSADKVAEFGAERLAEMGTNTVWIGRESKFGDYRKNQNVDMKALVAELRSCGVKTILSSILLLDQHTKQNIEEDIDDHLACEPTFSQFSHCSPAPGTPLYQRLVEEDRILSQIPFEEWHAFKQPWFIHPEFSLQEAEAIQERAYLRDFHELGPAMVRFLRADYEGWQRFRTSSQPYHQVLARDFAGRMWLHKVMLSAMSQLVPTEHMRDLIRDLSEKIEREFGPITSTQKAVAAGLFISGRFREFRTRHWGDTLQPPFKVYRYNQ